MPSSGERFAVTARCVIVAPQAVKIESGEQTIHVAKGRSGGPHCRTAGWTQPHGECLVGSGSHHRALIWPRVASALARSHRSAVSHYGPQFRRRNCQRVREIPCGTGWTRARRNPCMLHAHVRVVRPQLILESAKETAALLIWRAFPGDLLV